MNYAEIIDGICTNVIVADEDFASKNGLVSLPNGYGIGDSYNGTEWIKFSQPEADIELVPYTPTLKERTAALESAMLAMMGVNPSV